MQRLIGGSTFEHVSWIGICRSSCPAIRAPNGLVRTRIPSHRAASTLNFRELDQKWQKRWRKSAPMRSRDGREKDYVLAMFPYPSGALHMGHVRVYTIADVLARFKRMVGNKTSRDVMYPMGWDAFGLPAENAAIERGLDPTEWTKSNIAKMKEQLQAMNTDIDWSRELMTCSPDFYKHTQRLFLLLHEHGLAYQAESLVNYDPVDQTVLANEQVDSNGFSWRSGAKVEKLSLKQWFFKITDFKDELLQDLGLLTKWPERVISMQQNWLGKSTGSKLNFGIEGKIDGLPKSIAVFTTRLDTLFGVQFLALAPNHALVIEQAKHDPKLVAFLETILSLPEGSKAGYLLHNVSARNPLAEVSGSPAYVHDPLSIWVAPYVRGDYGAGAVMGVPAHDERDLAFWKINYEDIPVRAVIAESNGQDADDFNLQDAYTNIGQLRSTCGAYAGLSSEDAAKQIHHDLKAKGIAIDSVETWRLRDWLISRQRYWGTPIPIIHCRSCGPVPVPLQDLPVELPTLDPDTFKQRKGNPLEQATEWVNVKCPKCEQPAKRDTDTMDTFVDSSWYMFRFADPHNTTAPFEAEKADQYMPVGTYVGGIEHAILHLLYARFIGKFLAKIGMWSKGSSKDIRGEPFRQLISQGMVHGKTYSDPDTGRFFKPEEINTTQPARPLIRSSQRAPNVTFEKMSKSKHNGVDPTEVISRHGADVTRVHMLFQAPISEVLEWDDARIVGVQRWLIRLHKYIESVASELAKAHPTSTSINNPERNPFGDISIPALSQYQAQLYLKTERTISSVTTALSETHALNTCISDLMTLTNELSSVSEPISPALLYHISSTIIKLLAPFAPAFAEEMWEILHSHSGSQVVQDQTSKSLFDESWPSIKNLAALEVWARQHLLQRCAVMENGKLRFVLDIEPLDEHAFKQKHGTETESARVDWALQRIRDDEKGREWLARKEAERAWKKIVVVRGGKTVNFVG